VYERKRIVIVEVLMVVISVLQYVGVLCYAILFLTTVVREEHSMNLVMSPHHRIP